MEKEEIYVLIKKRRLLDSFKATKIMKKIIKKYSYLKIDELLLDFGYKKNDKAYFYKNVTCDEFIHSTILTYVQREISPGIEVELSVYTDVESMPNQFIVTLMFGKVKDGILMEVLFGGEYHKEIQKKQRKAAFSEFLGQFRAALRSSNV